MNARSDPGRDSAIPAVVDPPVSERRSFVVGTAGHVDHGKSTLVKALTGIDPDRLAEEKARAMTIDLGFAWFSLPSGRDVSVVDVPGHERFIKNMLAGVGGLDAALLIVAADEGPMPQTVEHLAILDLLAVTSGLIVLTKRDAVDEEWLALVEEETRDLAKGSRFANATIVAVSALTGQGLPVLKSELDQLLAASPPPLGGHRPRLPIDRAFSVPGFGTVVTGTLNGGDLVLGQELRLFPHATPTRVRGLQSHQSKLERAVAGSRVAVNLTGLAVDEIRRGDVLAPPGMLTPTQRVDARLFLLKDAPIALEQNAEIDLFVGAAELPARVTLLDRARLDPGAEGWVQFRFRQPLALLRGDRLIIRRPSPSITIGGGEIVDPTPPRHRRFRPEVIDSLETLAAGSPDEIVLQAIRAAPVELRSLRNGTADLSPLEVDAAVEQLVAEGDALLLGPGTADGSPSRPGDFVAATLWWRALGDQVEAMLAAFHQAQPLRRGMPKEEVKSRLRLGSPRLFEAIAVTLVRDQVAVDGGQHLRRPDFQIAIDPARRLLADRYLAAIAASPFTPPGPAEFGLDAETLVALEDLGEVVAVAPGVAFHPAALERLVTDTLRLIDENGALTLAGFRDHFGSSRKYAQALLEFMDQRRLTRRVGDERIRYTGPSAGQWLRDPDERPQESSP